MTDCEKYRDLIPLLSGGELEEGERVSLIAHLAECSGCAEEAGRYRELRAALASLREVDPPFGTYEAIWQGVRHSLRGTRRRGSAWRIAALLLLGLGVGLIAGGLDFSDEPAEAPGGDAVVEERLSPPASMGVARFISDGPDSSRRRLPVVFSGSSLNTNHYLPGVRVIYPGDEVDF